ncbi:adenosine diphosphate sugar pyrophosphatase [Marinobacterium nitratireducens]|uniref:ADP-ribose pyrophosphatase n=1 Tax=Marinobacterium nitratireducens TaxID=518897 RepID=A0A917ZBU4_9GAMM|nr:NUDIX domain-containing protein [Marinobacterium nitratireducens]GGO78613.1 adenosine diphosphate sugar pyrophosphatase [Marinobacterium nitratireducens]
MGKDWKPQFGHRDFRIEQDEPLYHGFFRLDRLRVTHRCFLGGEVTIQRELYRRRDAVCVLPYDAQLDCLVLIEQFRVGTLDHPDTPWQLELVAGLVEQGESAEDVACREAVEEADLALGEIEHITRFTPSPGAAREYIDLLCARVDARDAGGVHGLAEEGEDIKVHRIASDAAFAMVRSGRIDNAPAIIAIQWLEMNRPRLRARWTNAENE